VTGPTSNAPPNGLRWLVDLVVAGVVTLIGVLGTIHMEVDASSDRPIDGVAVGCAVVAGGALVLWRRMPFVTAGVSLAAVWLYTARAYPGGPVYLAGAVALFAVAVVVDRRRAYELAAGVAVVMFVTSVVARRAVEWNDWLFLVWPTVAVLAADATRGRRERAASERLRLAEEAERARVEERLALARDLHDSVAHAMATINVQAGVAAHVIDRDPGQAATALDAIRVASRDVLDELQAMLGVLRQGEGAPRHPVADLGQLESLVASSRRAGVDVELQAAPVDGLPLAVSAAGYRVVQEGLTNVARHAPHAHARVLVDRPPGGLVVEVVDDGGGAPASSPTRVAGDLVGSGLGLVGVRERAEVTGGRCEIGPRAEGGFRLRVVWEELS
jgi:signal transduction histidine kinase